MFKKLSHYKLSFRDFGYSNSIDIRLCFKRYNQDDKNQIMIIQHKIKNDVTHMAI